MILSFNCILQTLKKYWPNDGGMASENIARKVIELITKDFSGFKSDTTYKTIFKKGPSKRRTIPLRVDTLNNKSVNPRGCFAL